MLVLGRVSDKIRIFGKPIKKSLCEHVNTHIGTWKYYYNKAMILDVEGSFPNGLWDERKDRKCAKRAKMSNPNNK